MRSRSSSTACWRGSLHQPSLPAQCRHAGELPQSPSGPGSRQRRGEHHCGQRGWGSNGIVNYKEADLARYVTALDGAGFGIHMHSIGDRSTRVALDALEAARASNGNSGIPHTLAHLQVVHPDDQQRLGEYWVSTSPSPMPGPRPSLPMTCWSALHPANQGRAVPERGHLRSHGLSS